MQHLFILDPLERLQPKADTSIAFMREAARRGHSVAAALTDSLELEAGVPGCRATPLQLAEGEAWYRAGETAGTALGDYDVVWMRKDPPFDMAYLYATMLLSMTPSSTLVVNEPRALRDANEKLFAQVFPEYCPATVVTADMGRLRRFREEQGGQMVVKPLDGAGGEGIFHVTENDRNAGAILETVTRHGSRMVMAQQFIPEIADGDKRIILVEGEAKGAVLRIPAAHEARANFHAGGRAARTELSARDNEICSVVGPRLRDMGVVFAGIDVIGDYLTEVNVTSPTGIREIKELDGIAIEEDVLDAVEARVRTLHDSPSTNAAS